MTTTSRSLEVDSRRLQPVFFSFFSMFKRIDWLVILFGICGARAVAGTPRRKR